MSRPGLVEGPSKARRRLGEHARRRAPQSWSESLAEITNVALTDLDLVGDEELLVSFKALEVRPPLAGSSVEPSDPRAVQSHRNRAQPYLTPDKTPVQSPLVPQAPGIIELDPELADVLHDLDGFDYAWLLAWLGPRHGDWCPSP